MPRGLFSSIPGLQPPTPDPFIPAVSTEAVSRHCSVSPAGQNRPQMGIAALDLSNQKLPDED